MRALLSILDSAGSQQPQPHPQVVSLRVTDALGARALASAVAHLSQPPQSAQQALITALSLLPNAATVRSSAPAAALALPLAPTLAAAQNMRDCTLPADGPAGSVSAVGCGGVGRLECSQGRTPRSCGPCLPGFVGQAGDSNFPCADTNFTSSAQIEVTVDRYTSTATFLHRICGLLSQLLELPEKTVFPVSGILSSHLISSDGI